MSGQLGGSSPQTGAHAVVQNAVVTNAVDPSRRPDVLLRVRREEGHEVSAWWMVGAFVGVSLAVIALLSFVPGGA
ncbi:MAG: UDP-N-acetylmuramyl pentapeptide phosphotransferase [Microbacterium sp.]